MKSKNFGKIHPYPGLAKSGYEQPGPGVVKAYARVKISLGKNATSVLNKAFCKA